MSYRVEGKDIVIDGFEQGIAPSPYATNLPTAMGNIINSGIADMRNMNVVSVPGEVSVNTATVATTIPPVGQTGISFTAVGATDVVTVSSTAGYYPGMAIELVSSSVNPLVNALLVAGGAGAQGLGGGTVNTGGGGGGQVTVLSGVTVTPQAYAITVGVGGAAGGGTGANSIALGTTATGGVANSTLNGGASGSGNAGGAGNLGGGNAAGGGGGGDSAAGTAGTQPAGNAQGGNGGNGTANSLSGASVTYGGGGGGGAYGAAGNQGSGGTGGGGAGGRAGLAATAGTANTGGGGGGAGGTSTPQQGAAGGSGIVIISYATGSLTATGGSITTSGGNTIHTFNSTGTWTVTAIGPVVGNTFYVGNISGNTFKLYNDLELNSAIDFLIDSSGTLTVPSLASPVWSTYFNYFASATSAVQFLTFMIDNTGNCWYITSAPGTGTGGTVAANSVQFTGNTGHAASGTGADFGIVAWMGYLFVIVGRNIDYISISNLLAVAGPNGKWTYNWNSSSLSYTQYQHQAISATDGAVYICNGSSLASILVKSGQSFDPTNSATYTLTASALALPTNDYAQCLAQLGTSLLVGGILNYIYPWDRLSTSFSYPLVLPESNTVRIVTSNSTSYIFCGNRGRIYLTNGADISYYTKLPDYLSGVSDPYMMWGDAMYWKNQLYFTATATTNAGGALSTIGGVWAIDLASNALRGSNQLSYGTYGGTASVLSPILTSTPAGGGFYAGWTNAGTAGIDVTTSTLYTGGQAYVDTDIIPVGTFYNPDTLGQVEYKLASPLVAGESVQILARANLSANFTSIFTSTAQQISDAGFANFEKNQWVQFRVVTTAVASNPSGCRLRELRFR